MMISGLGGRSKQFSDLLRLHGRAGALGDVDGRFLGLHEELAHPADAEAVVGRLGLPADLDGVFVDHVLVRLGVTGRVVNVPTQGAEEWVDELVADLGLVVSPPSACMDVATEAFDQFADGLWNLAHDSLHPLAIARAAGE